MFDCDFRGGVEIGSRLKALCWNQGYATEAAKRVLQIGKEIGLNKIYSFTAISNRPSERVMQKIGLKKEGEFEHPALPEGHWLRKYVLYSIELQFIVNASEENEVVAERLQQLAH